MAFTPKTDTFACNGVNAVTLESGVAGGPPKQVKAVVIYNADSVNHKIIIDFVRNTVHTTIFGITIGPGDTLVQDIPIVLTDDKDTLSAKLGEAMTSTNPVGVITYAQIG